MSDLYKLQSSDLGRFIDNHVQADANFRDCCGEVIDTIVKHLQGISGKLKPKRVLKSGSLGKGTAVKGRADIDLVIMLNEYTEVEQLMKDMEQLLKSLKAHVLKLDKVKHQKTTRYSVQIETMCRKQHNHDVDILPAVDLLEAGCSTDDIFRKMASASPTDIHEYSVSLAPIQLEIIKQLPPKVKSLITLIKYWKEKYLKGENEPEMPSLAEKRFDKPNWPTSYPFELVIISAWNDVGNPENFDMAKALHAVLTSLINHKSFKIMLEKQMKYSSSLARKSKTPFIMDPANPFNDMYHGLVGGEAFDWENVVPEAKRWLSQPLFSGIKPSKQW